MPMQPEFYRTQREARLPPGRLQTLGDRAENVLALAGYILGAVVTLIILFH